MEILNNLDINSVDNLEILTNVLDNIHIDEIIALGDQNLVKKTVQTYQKYISLLLIEKDQSVFIINNLNQVLSKIVEQTQIKLEKEKINESLQNLFYGKSLYQCFCGKIFKASSYLKKHFLRRHYLDSSTHFNHTEHEKKNLSTTRKLHTEQEMVSSLDESFNGSISQPRLKYEADTHKENSRLFTTTETLEEVQPKSQHEVDTRKENSLLCTKEALSKLFKEQTEDQETCEASKLLPERDNIPVIQDDSDEDSSTDEDDLKDWDIASTSQEDGIIEAGDHPRICQERLQKIPQFRRTHLPNQSNSSSETISEVEIRDPLLENDSPELYYIIKRQIQQQIDKKLQVCGIDPLWKKIPKKTFEKLMKILNHQVQMAKKVDREFEALKNQYSHITVVNRIVQQRLFNKISEITPFELSKYYFNNTEKDDDIYFH